MQCWIENKRCEMDVTLQDILKTLIGTGILSVIVIWWLNRPKQRKEIQAILIDSTSKIIAGLNEYIITLDNRINNQEKLINRLQEHEQENIEVIAALKKDNEELKYKHKVIESEINILKKISGLKPAVWRRCKVYVIDDDKDELDVFAHKLGGNTVIDYRGFTDIDTFLIELKLEHPEYVIIDYRLSDGKTAQYILDALMYEPEIFIISGVAGFEARIRGDKNIHFFEKDDFYVYKISEQILKHISERQ